MPATHPTILIKKKDGAYVRMTMAEFALYKKGNEDVGKREEGRGKRKEEGGKRAIPDNLPMVEGEQHLAMTAPVKEIFVDEAVAKHFNTTTLQHDNTSTSKNIKTKPAISNKQSAVSNPKIEIGNLNSKFQILNSKPVTNSKSIKDDYRSLLEEDLPTTSEPASQPATVATKEKLAEAMSRLSFPIADELRGRWESLLISRIKNVRDDDQLKSYLQKNKETGGLGLSEANADEAIQVIKMMFNLGRNFGSLTKANKKLSASAVASVATPKPRVNSAVSSMKKMFSSFSKSAPSDNLRAASNSSGKPVLHDVVVPPPRPAQTLSASIGPESKNMSPIDELGAFTLTDFRRLSKNADEAGQLVQKKFAVLKEESYLLFLQAVSAWRESPFYHAYQKVLQQALKNSETLERTAGLGSEDGLSIKEVEAVIKIGEAIG